MSIKEKLDKLADHKDQRVFLDLTKQELINEVYTDEIKEAVKEIELEFAGQYEAVDENIKNLTAEIKTNVLEHGEKVKGSFLQAVWVKGRAKWDTKGLKGYAKAHPEVGEFLTEGNPSVSIRKVQKE